MRATRSFMVLVLVLGAALLGAAAAGADTHAPSAQTFVLTCEGSTTPVTFVSPVGAAEAAQILAGTGVGILEEITDSAGNVVFEHPALNALSSSAVLTTCTDQEGFTYLVLVTPQHR
jgi:ABC-type phosphate transport system substrate-binding protein